LTKSKENMIGPYIAIVGDADLQRTFDPPMNDPKKAKQAAVELGTELAKRGARLLVYGGPFLEADVVEGFVVPWVWGKNAFEVWMLFIAPLLAGGAGAAIRPMVDRQRGTQGIAPVVLVTVVLGLVAGGIAGVLFVTAQLTANPDLITGSALDKIVSYAQRSIPFAVGIGFVAGLTSDVVFGKLLGLDVVRATGIGNAPTET
jgi:hypothetical protein